MCEGDCFMFFFLLLQRVQAALPPSQQHHMSVTMTPPRVVTNTPVHEHTPSWQQGQSNHHSSKEQQKVNNHSMVQQQANNHSKGQAPKRSHRDYIFGKVIGEGSFSTVYLAKDIHNGKECASKQALCTIRTVHCHSNTHHCNQ
jgi:3-phosphoinositide dependent protein kinase-1